MTIRHEPRAAWVASLVLVLTGVAAAACSTAQQSGGSPSLLPAASPSLGAPAAIGVPSPTEAPGPASCPVLVAVCTAASLLQEALKQGDVGFVIRTVHFREVTCPIAPPAGKGGPYPLCDADQGRGQTLLGFTVLNDVTGLMYDASTLEGILQQAIDASTKDGDWRLRSVACRQQDVEPATGCSGSLAVFGYEAASGKLAGTSVLMFEFALTADGRFAVERITTAFAIPKRDTDVLLNGGDLHPQPAHLATFGFGPFHRWSTP